MDSHLHLFRPPTYAELKARHDALVTNDLHNRHTAINRWMEKIGASDGTRVGTELGPDYHDRLRSFVSKFAVSTQAHLKSHLNRYRKIYFELLESGKLPLSFHEALKVLIVPHEKDLLQLAKKADVAVENLKSWLSGAVTPGFRSEAALKRLEREFRVPNGTLVNRLPHLRLGKRKRRTGETVYGRRIQELQDLPFRCKFEAWPENTREQWNNLVRHKTATLLPKAELRNKKWNVDKLGRCSTAETRLVWVENYFGFLRLPKDHLDRRLRGKGLPTSALDLALLSDTEMLNDFIEFTRDRSGVYTEFCSVWLDFIYSLCLPRYGWLGQRAELASHQLLSQSLPESTMVHGKAVPLSSQAEQWAEWLSQTCAWIKDNRKSLRDKVEKGRDHEPIDAYLASEHPMNILFTLADTMEKHFPVLQHQSKLLAISYRDMFLVRFLTANPLRIEMFAAMTFRPDNKGNLHQRNGGEWWLRFAAKDFKNFAGAAKDSYSVPLATSLWPFIETYLRVHRPLLAGAGSCEFVFRPDARPGIDPSRPMNENGLSDIIRSATQYFIPGCAGFGPHAFRHIIATDIIKNDQLTGWARAAAALHDQLDTVLASYSHLKTSDHMAQWNAYHEDKLSKSDGHFVDPTRTLFLRVLNAALARGITDVRALIRDLESRGDRSSFLG